MASILGSAVKYQLLVKDPMDGVQVRRKSIGKRVVKPHIISEEFESILNLMREAYATMVYVAVYSGLRVPRVSFRETRENAWWENRGLLLSSPNIP